MSHAHTRRAREAKQATAESMGIDPDFISQMVDQFYERVRADPALGPIFDDRIGDWPHHLDRMKAFWRSVLHQSGGFNGNPMLKHIAIPGIERAEFERWLALFDATLGDLAKSSDAAKLIAARARMIASSLLTGIRIHRDGKSDPASLKVAFDA
jgi:hemoglobin